MEPIDFKQAYYIKLGPGGKYEDASIRDGIACIGYDGLPTQKINGRDWEDVKDKLQKMYHYGSRGAATMDVNALKTFVESTADDIWITFHASQLWWGRLGESLVHEQEGEDKVPRYRVLMDGWHNHDINGNVLLANQIPGSIAKIQRFAAVICKVQNEKDDPKFDDLKRLINDCKSDAWLAVSQAKKGLEREVQEALKRLNWRDFEILVDLIFRNSGWRQRTSSVGGSMKYADIELEAPITGDLYQVQVKAQATVEDFENYAKQFPGGAFKKLYFVVSRPDEGLREYPHKALGNAELILPARLAEMVVDLGITDWLLKKIK